ncbi:MAG: hypothetical protein A2075_20805 [Geobacteraceae bacterium GWC2_58_44]|nr:MAG: hypothetical protein A2075_20805 [Geobacteraceae bacterium GWC2_58_44]
MVYPDATGLVGAAITVTMAAAGMARGIFRQFMRLEKGHVFGDGSFSCLENAEPRTVEFMQRPAADAANHDGIHLMAVEPRYRVAGPMLMDPVAVVD